jgi:hypothetical protein
MLSSFLKTILFKQKHLHIIQFSPPRTGSTLVWNAIRLFGIKAEKTHKFDLLQKSETNRIVSTIRNPYDMVCSSIHRYRKPVSEDIVRETIKMFESYNFNSLLELKKQKDVLILKYENFYDNFDYLIEELERFFGLQIEPKFKEEFTSKFSRKEVSKSISNLPKFGIYNPDTLFHGNHIGPDQGRPNSYKKYLNDKMIGDIQVAFSKIFSTFNYN